MSLLGHDALGHWAFGHPPDAAVSTITLAALPSSFALTGVAATFATKEVDSVGSFAFTGVSASFTLAEAQGTGSFAFTGVTAAFKVSEVASAGGFVLTGIATTDSISEPLATGTFAYAGAPATFTILEALNVGSFALTGISAGEIVSETLSPGSFTLTGFDAASFSPITFSKFGDAGKNRSAEEEWSAYRRRREELRNSIRRARRRLNGDLNTPLPDASVPVRKKPAATPPLYIPPVDLDLRGIVSTLGAISAQLNALEQAFEAEQKQPLQEEAAPQQPDLRAAQEAAQALMIDDEMAISALLAAA